MALSSEDDAGEHKKRKPINKIFLCAFCVPLQTQLRIMKTPDLVLKNGMIIDGTGRMRYDADVAIRRNYILAIDRPGTLSASEEIDCSGLIIAPGFIDTHSHSDL